MATATPLASGYAGIVLDIDGVCVLGSSPVPGAPRAIRALRDLGIGLTFATNNAMRTTAAATAHLRDAGIDVDDGEVVTASRATAELLDAGTRCLVVGMQGLTESLLERGCTITDEPAAAEAVVVGLDTTVTYDRLANAALAIRGGARFLGTNPDPTYPSERGLLPGNGAFLAALSTATGVTPQIAGKPQAPLFRTAAARLPDGPPLMVGDRLDTDIAGAAALGWDTALVLSGSTGREGLAQSTVAPTYVLESITALLEPAAP